MILKKTRFFLKGFQSFHKISEKQISFQIILRAYKEDKLFLPQGCHLALKKAKSALLFFLKQFAKNKIIWPFFVFFSLLDLEENGTITK
jgi:hypothetical protein